ncbi:MAG: hypothetical protein JRH18_09600 [Deltaproteobacteria bacterium]|nr:hypothetical protein [Deltaproteobacteria bacterium]MBW2151908.1 hypothetical protein [Deltaproteobacteria bacterium]
MTSSQDESKVINLLRELMVATIDVLCNKLSKSRITVLRALKSYGYFSSFNFNSSYFTLKDIPHFDKDGLWFHGEVGFSRYGTLTQTIKAIIDHSEKGYTVVELQKLLGTKVHNQLSLLCRKRMLTRFYVGRNCVYISVEPKLQASQEAKRKEQIKKPKAITTIQVPQGLEALTVIRLLVEMIQEPDATAASLSQRFQRQGLHITAEQVRGVIEFYSLVKKTEN